MTNEKVLSTLKQIKTICSASQLEEIDYVIQVMEKLIKEGIDKPLEADFSKLKN